MANDLLHALGCLSGYVNEDVHFKLGFNDMKMLIQTRSITPLCYNRQLRLGRTTHEQQNVYMSGFPETRKQNSPLCNIEISLLFCFIKHNYNINWEKRSRYYHAVCEDIIFSMEKKQWKTSQIVITYYSSPSPPENLYHKTFND